MSRPLVRGRKGWERRLAERSEEPRERQEPKAQEPQGLELPPSAGDGAPIEEPRARPPSIRTTGGVPAARGPQLASAPPESRAPGPGRRLPDLAALPPLLGETAAFASLRERLRPPQAPPGKEGPPPGGVAPPPRP